MELKYDANNEYLPLRDVVFQALRQAIITGELSPGERLKEIKIANKGLVVMIPRKGAEVARITEKDLRDALEVRTAIEELSVELACARITEEGKEKLKKACMDFKEAIDTKHVQNIVDGDVKFHDVIFEATGNQRLIGIAHNLREQVYRYRVEYVKDFSYHDVLVKEHYDITNAILMNDVKTAKEIMRHHLYNQELIVIKNMQDSL